MKHYLCCDFAEPETQDKNVYCVLAYDEKRKQFVIIDQGEFKGQTILELREEHKHLKHFWRATEFDNVNVFDHAPKDNFKLTTFSKINFNS